MVAETLTPTIQREFIQNAIKSGIRSDGRAFNDFRGIKITIGPEVGYSQVQLGKTR